MAVPAETQNPAETQRAPAEIQKPRDILLTGLMDQYRFSESDARQIVGALDALKSHQSPDLRSDLIPAAETIYRRWQEVAPYAPNLDKLNADEAGKLLREESGEALLIRPSTLPPVSERGETMYFTETEPSLRYADIIHARPKITPAAASAERPVREEAEQREAPRTTFAYEAEFIRGEGTRYVIRFETNRGFDMHTVHQLNRALEFNRDAFVNATVMQINADGTTREIPAALGMLVVLTQDAAERGTTGFNGLNLVSRPSPPTTVRETSEARTMETRAPAAETVREEAKSLAARERTFVYIASTPAWSFRIETTAPLREFTPDAVAEAIRNGTAHVMRDAEIALSAATPVTRYPHGFPDEGAAATALLARLDSTSETRRRGGTVDFSVTMA